MIQTESPKPLPANTEKHIVTSLMTNDHKKTLIHFVTRHELSLNKHRSALYS